jgi:pimeloyl-ACP methyl ester carboxylesterase
MSGWLLGLCVALLATLLWAAIREVRVVAPRARPRLPYAEEHLLATEDGAFVELRRLPPPSAPAPLPPVLCVHGIGIDHHNLDMFEGRSLARHLMGRGRDVWLLTLRSGMRSPHRRPALTSFDRMARYDVPLAIREVLAKTGAPALDYVGFSMGGMLAYAALGQVMPKGAVERVAIMGSPGLVEAPDPISRVLAHLLPAWLVPHLPLETICRLLARPASWILTPIHERIVHTRNMIHADYKVAMATIASISRPLLQDFKRFVTHGGLVRFEGKALLPPLADLDLPLHVVAGEHDHVAPPHAVKAAFDLWGSAHRGVQKAFWIAGHESGAVHGYGHGDLAMGVRVELEVLVRVGDFLMRQGP